MIIDTRQFAPHYKIDLTNSSSEDFRKIQDQSELNLQFCIKSPDIAYNLYAVLE